MSNIISIYYYICNCWTSNNNRQMGQNIFILLINISTAKLVCSPNVRYSKMSYSNSVLLSFRLDPFIVSQKCVHLKRLISSVQCVIKPLCTRVAMVIMYPWQCAWGQCWYACSQKRKISHPFCLTNLWTPRDLTNDMSYIDRHGYIEKYSSMQGKILMCNATVKPQWHKRRE